jgi:hypothetical protein
MLLWHGQKGFESEDKSKQLEEIQKKEHHLITWKEGSLLAFLCPREPALTEIY